MVITLSDYPLITQLLAQGSSNKPLCHMNGELVLADTERAIKFALKDQLSYVESKCKKFRETEDSTSASAILGELRALGEILASWELKNLTCPMAGSDFTADLDGQRVHIEVHTLQERSEKRRTTFEHEATEHRNLRTQIVEKAPLGFPGRVAKPGDTWGCDNVQGEAVSKICAIKGKEHQFDPAHINILWLDFRDTLVWPMDLMKDQDVPLLSFNEHITSGAIWSAFYAKKGTPIYYQLNIDGMSAPTYLMEYDGRFQGGSLIDFAVLNLEERITVFGNPKRCIGGYSQALIRSLHRPPRFSLEHSWLPIPHARSLSSRVCRQLQATGAYSTIFRMP